jgi:hypothetical protein
MAKKRRKTAYCLNCGHELGEDVEFCKQCGQENHDQNLPIAHLIAEFLATFFAIDARMWQSLKRFFFYPGFLTNRFNEGQRVKYSNPVRMYVVTSVFYFFTFTYFLGAEINKSLDAIFSLNVDLIDSETQSLSYEELLTANWFQFLPADAKADFLPDSIRARINKDFPLDSALKVLAENPMFSKARMPLKNIDSLRSVQNQQDTLNRNKGGILAKARDTSLSDHEFVKGLGVDVSKASSLGYQSGLKFRKMLNNQAYFVDYALRNLPLMMIFMIPIFSSVLMLFYHKQKKFFIEHVIHGLHIHSMGYIIYGLALITIFNLPEGSSWAFRLVGGSFVLASTYAYISFLNVYKQGWIKTFFKFNFVGFIYFTALFLFLLLEFFVSLLLF